MNVVLAINVQPWLLQNLDQVLPAVLVQLMMFAELEMIVIVPIVGQLTALPDPMVELVMRLVIVQVDSVVAVPVLVEPMDKPAQQVVTVQADSVLAVPAVVEPMEKPAQQVVTVQTDSVLAVFAQMEQSEPHATPAKMAIARVGTVILLVIPVQ